MMRCGGMVKTGPATRARRRAHLRMNKFAGNRPQKYSKTRVQCHVTQPLLRTPERHHAQQTLVGSASMRWAPCQPGPNTHWGCSTHRTACSASDPSTHLLTLSAYSTMAKKRLVDSCALYKIRPS
jgi:hypothetical protein